MSSKQIVLYPTTQEERDALPMVSDVQFMDKFASTAINQKFAGVFQSGVYRGFDVVDSGNGVVTVAGSADGDTAIVNLAGNICMTVNAQSAINVQLEAGVSYTLVLNAFYEHGTTTTQVDSTSQIPPASLSLVPYGTESSEQVVLADVQWDGVGAVVIDVNRRQNGSPLNVYSKDHVDTVLSAMSEAESLAIRQAKHAKFAANDFIYHGKNSVLTWARVNEGLTAYGSAGVDHVNQFYLGPAHSSQSGDSPTVMPVFNMGGAEIPFSAFTDRFPFKLPPAEKGYRTYNSNGGASIDFLTELAGYDTLPLTEDEAKIRAFYSGIDIDSMTVNDGQAQIDRFTATSVDSGGYISFYSHTPLVVGRKYYVDFEIIGTLNGTTRVDIASAVGGQYGVGRHKVTIENAGATSNFIRVHGDGAGANFTLKLHEAREATVSVVKNRVDLSTLEIYQEESTDGELFPFCIQSKASNVISGVPMVLSKRPKSYFAQYEGQYENPEEQNDEFYCWSWPSLTFAQKKLVAQYLGETLFMGKNGYLVQDRVRARTFAGNGNGDWVSINPAVNNGVSYNVLQFGNAAWENLINVQGDNDVPYTSHNDRYRPAPNARNKLGGKGVYNSEYGLGGYNSTGVTYQAACFMYVVATTPRLNAAGWHPSHNPMGACTLDLDSSVFGSQVDINSFLDCCLNATNGDIASGVSGRPDGKYFDAIYPSGEGGIVDHRLKYGAWDASDPEHSFNMRNEVALDTTRGREKLKEMIPCTVSDFGWSYDYFIKPDGSYLKLSDIDIKYRHLLKSTFGTITAQEIGIVIPSAESILVRTDTGYVKIPGNSQYSHVVAICPSETNITVEGKFNRSEVYCAPDELLQNKDFNSGWMGSWGGSWAGVQPAVMSRNCKENTANIAYSADSGATWTQVSTTLDKVKNQTVDDVSGAWISILSYQASAYVVKKAGSKLTAMYGIDSIGKISSFSEYAYGCDLAEGALGKVLMQANNAHASRTVMIENISARTDMAVWDGWSRPTYTPHSNFRVPANLTSDGTATGIAVVDYQVVDEDSGQASLAYKFKELHWDAVAADWGDDGYVETDIATTRTDLNGNTVASGTVILTKPYGWIKDKA